MQRAALLLTALVLGGAVVAGCGGGSKSASSTTSTTAAATTVPVAPDPALAMKALIRAHPSMAGTVTTLYKGATWSVVDSTGHGKATAVAFQLIGNKWQADLTKNVAISVLGPQPGERVSPIPQIAIEFKSKGRFTESALWLDGVELPERGGGSPRDGTIYGSPNIGLTPGEHVAVGFATTASHGSAVAWIFDVPG